MSPIILNILDFLRIQMILLIKDNFSIFSGKIGQGYCLF